MQCYWLKCRTHAAYGYFKRLIIHFLFPTYLPQLHICNFAHLLSLKMATAMSDEALKGFLHDTTPTLQPVMLVTFFLQSKEPRSARHSLAAVCSLPGGLQNFGNYKKG
jgi:hypothetical protein